MSKRNKRRFDSSIQPPVLAAQAVDSNDKAMKEILRALDAFSNQMARTGFGTNNLLEATEYPITRLTNNYMLMQSLYRSNWIAQRCVDAFPEEMCKVEPELTCQLPPEELDDFYRAVSKTNVWRNLEWSLKLGNLFGGAGAIIVIDHDENFLDTPLDIESIRPDSFKGIIPFDRWSGITPQSAVCQDINNIADFGLPEMYRVTTQGNKSFDIHCSRVLRFVGRELPMWEKQAMMYWGESVLEPVFEEIRKRDNTSFNIVSLMFRAQILGLKDDMLANKLSGASMNAQQLKQFQDILSAQNAMMSNQGMLVFGKDGGLESHQYSFGGISDVYHEFMKDIAAAAEIPYEIMFGRDSGLGSNGESGLQVYYDRVAHKQTGQLRPQLDKLYPVIAMSCWGEVPKDFGYKFPIARTVTNKERADLCEAYNKPVMDAFNSGLISQEIALKELQQNSKITNVFTNITDEFVERSDKQVSQPGEMGGPFEGGKEETGDEFGGDRAIDSVYSQPGAATHDDFVLGPVDAMKRFHGLDVVIETPKGTRREGTWWRNTMPADYGFIRGTHGADGDEMDCYIGPSPSSPIVFVVDQDRTDGSGRFDEHKCFLGFDSVDAAQTCYMAGHTDGMKIFRGISALPMPDFKHWLKHGNHRKPITNYYRNMQTWRAADAEFKESELPRVQSGPTAGQFTKGGGGESGSSAKTKAANFQGRVPSKRNAEKQLRELGIKKHHDLIKYDSNKIPINNSRVSKVAIGGEWFDRKTGKIIDAGESWYKKSEEERKYIEDVLAPHVLEETSSDEKIVLLRYSTAQSEEELKKEIRDPHSRDYGTGEEFVGLVCALSDETDWRPFGLKDEAPNFDDDSSTSPEDLEAYLNTQGLTEKRRIWRFAARKKDIIDYAGRSMGNGKDRKYFADGVVLDPDCEFEVL